MKVESLNTSGSHLVLGRAPVVERSSEGTPAPKTLGESPPIVLDLKDIGRFAAMFSPTGVLSRLRKRLNYLKNKKCRIVPAKGHNACVDDQDTVYIGVGLLEEYENDPETLAGILAHEWGHSCALKPNQEDMQKLNWNQIFELRRAHETLADETSGRLLFLLGMSPQGVINFLTKGKETHNLKYHRPELRAQVIQYGFEAEKRKAKLAQTLFPGAPYKNFYNSTLLDIA